MLKKTVFALAAAYAAGAAAQQAARPDPADPAAATKATVYEPALKDYRPYADPALARWREANEEVRRLGGHRGQAPASGKPAAQSADGARR